MRLAKYLAHSGVASRRAAEVLIAAGRVTVDGQTVTDPALSVDESNVVNWDGERVRPEGTVVYAVNKPAGVISTAIDTHGRPTVTEMIGTDKRLYPVGRLDADSTGLILVTNDGELANRLTHPRYEVPKTYRVTTRRPITDRALHALADGVELDDGMTAKAKVTRTSSDAFEIVLREGRNRQVRRMCEAVGHRVAALERVRFGSLALDNLQLGQTRKLKPKEVEELREVGGGQVDGGKISHRG